MLFSITRTTERRPAVPEKGTVLLLALIVMSSVVLSSMGLGSLIVSALQQSRVIDNAMVAYYAAETGAEDALYSARRLDTLPASVATPRLLSNGSSWMRTVLSAEDVLYVGAVPAESLVEVPLYDPDTELPSTAVRVDVTWSGTGVLTTSLIGWQPGSPWDPADPASVDFTAGKVAGGTASLSLPSPGKLYRLRLRASGAAMDDVRVHAYNATGQPVPLPGRLQIDSRGTFAGVEQKLLVRLPRKSPLSGIYDFAVFSECSIVKGGTVTCP